MTAVKTLQIRIVNPRAERLIDELASLDLIEIDEDEETDEDEEPETALEWYRRWCRDCDERYEQRKRAGLIEEPEPTMEEIVALCKEARAERYAEEQEQKKAAGR